MQVYPAIDIQNACCVRLVQGDFNQSTQYYSSPLIVAERFINSGSQWLHIVDLDGAQSPDRSQADLICSLASKYDINIQTGGGIRNENQIKRLINNGVTRVMLGSLAVKQPDLVKRWLQKFGPNKIVLALDVNIVNDQAFIATQGWQQSSQTTIQELIKSYLPEGLQHVLCTDISRDGTLTEPNFLLYQQLQQQFPQIQFQASGGISQLKDLETLKKLNLSAAIVGRALYEQHFTLEEALQC